MKLFANNRINSWSCLQAHSQIYISRLLFSREFEENTGGQDKKKKKHVGHISGCYLVSSTRYSAKRNVNAHAGCCGQLQLPIMPVHTPRLSAGEVAVEYQHTAQIPCICFRPSSPRLRQREKVWQVGGEDFIIVIS